MAYGRLGIFQYQYSLYMSAKVRLLISPLQVLIKQAVDMGPYYDQQEDGIFLCAPLYTTRPTTGSLSSSHFGMHIWRTPGADMHT